MPEHSFDYANRAGTTLSVHVCKPITATLMFERKAFVIDAQQVQDCSLEIMHMDTLRRRCCSQSRRSCHTMSRRLCHRRPSSS